MKRLRWFYFLLIIGLLAACGGNGDGIIPGFKPTATLAQPSVSVTHAPDAVSALNLFTQAWQIENYAAMYALISSDSQKNISQEDFTKRYTDAMNALTLKELAFEILSPTTNPTTAQITFRVTYRTYLIGDLQRDLPASFTLENGEWRIVWDDGLIMPELKGGNTLAMDHDPVTRGDILDSQGSVIASQKDAVALGIVPGQINPNGEQTLLNELWSLTGIRQNNIRELYAYAGPDWYIPVGEALASDVNRRIDYLSSAGGLVMAPYTARFYDLNGIAPQSVGYVAPIPLEEANQYLRQGYAADARVGRAGIEKWGEQYLAGKPGGTLYVIGPQGGVIGDPLGNSPSEPAASIYLTFNKDVQYQAQQAMIGLRGAAVILERDTGRVLAIVSSPEYDPNLFDPINSNSGWSLGNLVNDADTPLVNRATQGQYPLGSVFKVITFSAALESGTYTPETKYLCEYHFTEIPGRIMNDWTWDHFLQDEKTQPSGELTLSQGLMRSCNPFFWHIGLDLYNQGRVRAVTDMARGFGLGTETGIGAVLEADGNVEDPTDIIMAVNEAIGQDPILVTPLQVARFTAAIGNGGTLYRPQIVDHIQSATGETISVFRPEAQSVLPINPDNLKALQDAMREVIVNPRGTAAHRFRNFGIPVFGKTGTAESGVPGSPHAWFAGYTNAQIPGVPDIAIVVIAENKGEGSDYAAPIFKRLVEIYFYGSPRSLYWWESNIGITRTATPPVTETPPGNNNP
jgi:penicillin-binding protein 2